MARTYLLSDTYNEVTDRIVAALEAGVAPWVCPWRRDCADGGRPHNGASGHVYKGINVVLTGMSGFASSRWYTYRQALALGGQVKRGVKGTTVIYWQFIEAKGTPDDEHAESATGRKIPILKSYAVFNAEQITWVSGSKHSLVEPVEEAGDADNNYEHVEKAIAATGAKIEHHGVRTFYYAATDAITVPVNSRFDENSAYFATVLHELGHWTGAEGRLNRDLKGRFGSESYAAEELVAELAAAFLGAELGVAGHLQHAEYIGSWIRVLKADKKAIFTTARLAQEAADYILGRKVGGTLDEPVTGQQEAA